MIILKAVYQMANIDSTFDEEEKVFFRKIMKKMDVQKAELKEFMDQRKENILTLGEQLSSLKAKKTFLLTLASMALVDNYLEEKESNLLKQLTDKLGVGKVNIEKIDLQEAEKFVLKIFSENSDLKDKEVPQKQLNVRQYNDLDIMMY